MNIISNKKRVLRGSLCLAAVWCALTLASCSKEEGEGGLATIRGKVYGYDYNSMGVLHDSGYVGGVRVYISFGDHTWVDEDTRTSSSGEFAFQGLQEGSYKLFVVSECDSCNFNSEYIIQHAEITSSDQELWLPDFVIVDM